MDLFSDNLSFQQLHLNCLYEFIKHLICNQFQKEEILLFLLEYAEYLIKCKIFCAVNDIFF